MPKPIAYVTWSTDSRSGRVTIETPETDAEGAHRAQAVAAALAASEGWGAETPSRPSVTTVNLYRPRDRHIGGGALREAAKYTTQDARDAAKAALRSLGYTVRAT